MQKIYQKLQNVKKWMETDQKSLKNNENCIKIQQTWVKKCRIKLIKNQK